MKKKEEKSAMAQIKAIAGEHALLINLSWLLAGLSAVVAMAPFYFIWRLLKVVLEAREDFASVAGEMKMLGLWAVLSAVGAILIYVGSLMCSHKAAFRVEANLKNKLMAHIMTLPLGLIEKEGSGKIRRIVNDSSDATETFIAHSMPDKVVSYVTPLCLVAMMLFFDWKIGLMCLIPALLAFLCMSGMTGKKLQEDMKNYQCALEVMTNEAVEYVRGVPVVKTFGQSVFSFNRFKGAIDSYEKWTIAFTKKMMIPMVFFSLFANSIFAFIIAAAFIFSGKGLSVNLILNLFFYIIFTPILTTTLLKVAYAGEASMVVTDALNRMNEIFKMMPLAESKSPKLPVDSSVEFENVSFAYDGSDKKALDGISLKIGVGEHVAFVGPSGGGKTTLASLVARFWDATGGCIKIGGVDVRDVSSAQLMEEVSYVFQDSKLLKMSILENIRLGNKDATREEVMEALERAQCSDIVEKFPDGIDTVIGSKGVYVSGGEAQRLSIARAFLKKSRILILDEATAFADPDNEEKIQVAFENLSREKTVIMIAHRLSTVTNADKIFVLSEGKIVESGKHRELCNMGGLYAKMWTEYNKAAEWKVSH